MIESLKAGEALGVNRLPGDGNWPGGFGLGSGPRSGKLGVPYGGNILPRALRRRERFVKVCSRVNATSKRGTRSRACHRASLGESLAAATRGFDGSARARNSHTPIRPDPARSGRTRVECTAEFRTPSKPGSVQLPRAIVGADSPGFGFAQRHHNRPQTENRKDGR